MANLLKVQNSVVQNISYVSSWTIIQIFNTSYKFSHYLWLSGISLFHACYQYVTYAILDTLSIRSLIFLSIQRISNTINQQYTKTTLKSLQRKNSLFISFNVSNFIQRTSLNMSCINILCSFLIISYVSYAALLNYVYNVCKRPCRIITTMNSCLL